MTASVFLPSGRDAQIRALSVEDELLLLDAERSRPAAETATLLLSRCATPLTTDEVRDLTVGDREALLLHVRRLTFGERMQCVIRCASAACGEPMDLELLVRDLLTDAPCAEVPGFRLPTGADQEAVTPLAMRDPRLAGEMLLARCALGDTSVPQT